MRWFASLEGGKAGDKSLLHRVLDWLDWMLPEAWNHEHNSLHHYKLGEEGEEGPVANPKPQMNYVERSPVELVERWKDLQWGWDELIHDEKMGGSVGHLSRCWRHIAQQFVPTKTADSGDSATEEEELEKTPVTVAGYPGLNFAMSREQIKSVPREKWRMVYDNLVIKGECVPRPAGEPRDDIRDKFDLAVTLEHFPHVVFGGKQLDDKDEGRCCGDECVLRDAACDAIAAAKKAAKKHSKHSKKTDDEDASELGKHHRSRKSEKKKAAEESEEQDTERFEAHMAEVASKLARYNGWDVQLLTAVKQPPAETKPEKASASLGAVPVFTAKKDPTPELNAHKVTAKAAAKPVEPKKPASKTAKATNWEAVTKQAHSFDENERANRVREAAANQEAIDKSMFDAAFAAADQEVETAEKELKKDVERIEELEKRLAEAEEKAKGAEKAEKKYEKKYKKVMAEAKAASEFTEKFTEEADDTFPAADLSMSAEDLDKAAAKAREARIEARREQRMAKRQGARASNRV